MSKSYYILLTLVAATVAVFCLGRWTGMGLGLNSQRVTRTVPEAWCRAADRHALAARWRTLQAENAPLRAVVDGQLCSVPADFYDTAILEKVPAGNFLIAQLIGKVLSECNLGISDQLIYRRIERLVKAGKLTQVTQGSGPYENILRLP